MLPEIFRAYDIRGIVGRTLTPAVVRAIGQALGTLALSRVRTFAIGRDGRHPSWPARSPMACAAGANVSTSAWSSRR
jgi:phosphomannomutase